jgi:[protein-PII] uridylyltransferase
MALDSFTVQDAEGGAFARADKLNRLSARIEQALSGKVRMEQELARQKPSWPSRADVFTVAPRVLIDNSASNTQTVIEVNGRDRPGFLYRVTRALSSLNLQISSAHVTTYGERAVDVFYVKDLFGLKIVNQTKLDQIRDTLVATIAEPAEALPAIAEAAASDKKPGTTNRAAAAE